MLALAVGIQSKRLITDDDRGPSPLRGLPLTDGFRMKFVVGLGGWVLYRQDLVGVC
ncbi:hypothetical protein [Streptomyces sp. NBC_00569]|uniref:hypothetical protein n=1 Tax=unclassified Streptomyces TaxID=2593676 RepID=UPI002E81063E|nr:hypothetical protein [Streptomyces sp. NBC_00569]WUB99085.1 hypothetical protein OHO83_46240 [Streptomyces sp. NBC_00569]